MTGTLKLLNQAEVVGIALRLDGEILKAAWPRGAPDRVIQPVLARLRARKPEVIELVRRRAAPSPMPAGVRLVEWRPKQPPVLLEAWSVVTDVHVFVQSTLDTLAAKLAGKRYAQGWSVRHLLDRLEQVGVRVEVRP